MRPVMIPAVLIGGLVLASRVLACDLSLQQDIQPILNQNCVVCHQNASPGGGLSLQRGAVVDNTVGVPSQGLASMPRITAGQPGESFLVHKLRGTHAEVGGSGAAMPIGGKLDAAELAAIEEWIGACEASR